MSTVEFLAVDDVIALHDALLDEHGGEAGVRDRGPLSGDAHGIDLPEVTEALHQAMLDVAPVSLRPQVSAGTLGGPRWYLL